MGKEKAFDHRLQNFPVLAQSYSLGYFCTRFLPLVWKRINTTKGLRCPFNSNDCSGKLFLRIFLERKKMPINSIGQILNDLLQGQVSLDRLQKFLFSEEVNTEYVAHSKEPKGNVAIKIENGNFYWVKDDNQREYLKTEVRDIQLQETNRPDLILKDINMEIKKGSFVAILGE